MLPTVSLIVPARNEERVIRNCIISLLNLDYPKDKLEIIVSIDGSTDKTLNICKRFEPKIKVVESFPKKCKAEALNEVLPLANGEIIGVFDADCIIEKNCLKEAVKHFSNKDIAGVAGLLKSYNRSENLLTRILSMETCFASFLEYFFSKHGANAHFAGKNIFIRKKVLEEIGNFDTYSFLEDVELSIQMKRNGYKVIFEPKAIIWHEEPNSLKSYIKQRSRWFRGNFRIKKSKIKTSLKDWLSDYMHAIPYYISPFSLLVGTILAIVLFLNLPLFIVLPLLILFLFNVGLIAYSRLKFKEPLRYLFLLPFWFILNNLYLFLVPKAYIEEKRNKEFNWDKIERSNYGNLEQILDPYR